jgi:hypothetical protein
MSVLGLQSPFERLSVLPTTVSWRGTWVNTETYFKNDVAVSPVNGASYILTGTTSVNAGSSDPSASGLWSQFSNTSTGIETITGLAPGISVDNTNPLQPIISNTGVLTVAAGAAVFVDNTDPQNPVVNSSAIASLAEGAGISIGGTPQVPIITNTGVRSIIQGLGISVSNPTGDVTIGNTGLISVVQGVGMDIDQTNPSNPVISNGGVISLATGSGLASTGGVNPTISNVGVLSVIPLDSSIIVDNTDPRNPVISSEAPLISIFSLSTDYSSVSPILPGSVGTLGLTGSTTGIFGQYVLSGAPNAQGIFMVDLSTLNLLFVGNPGSQVTSTPFSIVYRDTVTVGGPYTYTSSTFPSNYFLSLGQLLPLQATLGQSYFNVAAARATGMRVVSFIEVQNNTNATAVVGSSGPLYAVYYPNGLE